MLQYTQVEKVMPEMNFSMLYLNCSKNLPCVSTFDDLWSIKWLEDRSHKKHSRWPSHSSTLPPPAPKRWKMKKMNSDGEEKEKEKQPRHSIATCCGKYKSLNRKIGKYFSYLRNGYKANKRMFVLSYMVRAVWLRFVEKTAGSPNTLCQKPDMGDGCFEGYKFQAVYYGIGYINQRVKVYSRVWFCRKLISWLKILV